MPGVPMRDCRLDISEPDVPGMPDFVPDVPGETDTASLLPGVVHSVLDYVPDVSDVPVQRPHEDGEK